ncbi:MAG: hypothetical protein Q8P79_02680 [Nanoarchaeota archaeon]|nr:hypothetical protein [Nanoarchaeota archaeon]
MDFRRRYLNRLARIETPELKIGMDNDERREQSYDYYELRNYAKDLKRNWRDDVAKKRLSDLVVKLRLNV